MSDNVLDTIKQFWDSEEQPVISDQTDVDNDYEVFMTEKIWKPIIAQQVFVVHGN